MQKGNGEMIYDFSLCPLSVIASECLWWCQKKVLVFLSKASFGSITRIICLQVTQFQFPPYPSLNISLKHMVPRKFECNKKQGLESTWVGYWGRKQKMQIWTKWNIQARFLTQSNTKFSIHHLHGTLKTPNEDTMWEIDVKLMVVFSIYKTKMKKIVL